MKEEAIRRRVDKWFAGNEENPQDLLDSFLDRFDDPASPQARDREQDVILAIDDVIEEAPRSALNRIRAVNWAKAQRTLIGVSVLLSVHWPDLSAEEQKLAEHEATGFDDIYHARLLEMRREAFGV
ncbi:hypothetical protein [Hyphomicrobium sp.]|uniref:hypothetical protein n=1 Tax=Hyphomicrobium sp. TaxID=82 RepID=UPI002E2FC2FF|nr:hypothetical protein [Hyphomicrobium sp.]HEX2839921.1 hypothetical protein [Hyphomicrobium sp.]